MKHTKQLLLILIVAFLLVGLTTLAATDTTKNNTNTNTEKNTKINTQNIKDTIKTETTQTQEKQIRKTQKLNEKQESAPININTFDNLKRELNTGSGTKILNITKDIKLENSITLMGSNITNLTINGNQKTINGSGQYQFLFTKPGQTVTLNNLTITNCYYNYGGGAITNYNATLIINNSNLTHNKAGTSGGAIDNNQGTLNITNSNLTHNTIRELGNGGAIANSKGTLTITNSNLTGNNATNGGAIDNYYGIVTITKSNIKENKVDEDGGAINNRYLSILNITNSNLTHNKAENGGSIYILSDNKRNVNITLFNSTFIENKAKCGAVICTPIGYGKYNITYNFFKNNIATEDKETLNLGNYIREGTKIEENIYDNTDINLKTINLTTQDEKTTYPYGEDIILKYTIELTNKEYYDENILDKINKTLYIDTIEHSTTKEKNYTLSKLKPGYNTLYYKTCNSLSNHLILIGPYDSEITTDQTTYDHIDGIKNKLTINITDPTDEKGTINVTVKDKDEYKKLSSYSNVGNGYQLSTDALVEALQNIYPTLNQSYMINVTYSSEYTIPSSTEFTLNIIQKRNTTITHNILNNTEGNVQINITVLDAIYKTPIPEAHIKISGALTNETNAGIITDNTLTAGQYNITVNFDETTDYQESNISIDFIVEIDKDKKITELEEALGEANDKIDELNNNLTNANNKIDELNNNLTEANNKIDELNNNLTNANNKIDELKGNLTDANNKIDELKGNITDANSKIDELNNNLTETTEKLNNATNKINNLEKQVDDAEKTIANLTQELNTAKEENQEQEKIIQQLENNIKTQNNTIQQQNKEIQELKEQQKYTNEILNQLKEELNKLNHTTTLTVEQNGTTIGNTTLTANIENKLGTPIKNASIKALSSNGTVIGQATTNNNGQATIPINTTTDKETIKVVYDGNETYYKSETNITITVNKNDVNITLKPIKGIIGEKITLQAKLTDINGNTITGGNLAFKLNGKTLRSDGRFDSNAPAMKFSVKDGLVTYTINADLYLRNAKNLTASYSGNYKYAEKTSASVEAQIQKRYANITVTVTPNKVKQYETITIKVTAKDTTKNGKNQTLISDNTKVMLKINGVTLKDSKGKTLYVPIQKDLTATYNYTIPADMGGITSSGSVRNYPVTAIFVGDNYYPGARNVSNFQVERSNTTVTIKETKVVTKTNVLSVKATLTDYKGNNLKGTSKVTIKINGKNYVDAKTGKAKYWSVTDGVVDLKDIQVDTKTTIKRVMVVAGETQAYKEGRAETSNIIRV